MSSSRATCAYHVVKLPLRVTAREESILRLRVQVASRIYNAALDDLLARADAMHRDPRWQQALDQPRSADRTPAFSALRKLYGTRLTQAQAGDLGVAHWRSASRARTRQFDRRTAHLHGREKGQHPKGWMTTVVSARVAQAAGRQAYSAVEQWLWHGKQRPRRRNVHAAKTAWSSDNSSDWGVNLDTGVMHWLQPHGSSGRRPASFKGRKDLQLQVKASRTSAQWVKRLAGRQVAQVGITCDGAHWFALLCVKGPAYRDPEYIAAVTEADGWHVGVDVAPTLPAVVSETDSVLLELVDSDGVQRQKQDAKRLRRISRAQDRSRRATNPHAFDQSGSPISGEKQTNLSKTYRRRRRRNAELMRKARAERSRRQVEHVREVLGRGTRIAVEQTDYRAWARNGLKLGRRMELTSPGAFMARLRREAELFGGQVVELDTARLALSQHCLCGARARKELRQRVHLCDACGLGPLQRDLFSAFLARLVLQTGAIDLHDGPFDTPEWRAQAQRLCAVRTGGHREPPTPAPSPGHTPGKSLVRERERPPVDVLAKDHQTSSAAGQRTARCASNRTSGATPGHHHQLIELAGPEALREAVTDRAEDSGAGTLRGRISGDVTDASSRPFSVQKP